MPSLYTHPLSVSSPHICLYALLMPVWCNSRSNVTPSRLMKSLSRLPLSHALSPRCAGLFIMPPCWMTMIFASRLTAP